MADHKLTKRRTDVYAHAHAMSRGGGGKYLRPSPPEPTGKDAHLMSLPRGGGIGGKVSKNGLRYAKY